MIRNPLQVFSKHTLQLGETFVFYFGGAKKTIVSSDPAVMQRVLRTNYENYHKSEIQMRRMGHFLGKGLLTTHGEEWKTQRRLIQQGFNRDRLVALASIMNQSLDESLREFDKEIQRGPVDIYPQLMKMTFRMVSRSLFSTKIPDEDVDLISRTISAIQEFMVRQIVQPYLDPWFSATGELRKYEERRERGDAIIKRYIKERREENAVYDDLLQILMDARYSDGDRMSDELILSESMQLLVAGHETSSNALSWTLYLLSQNPRFIRPMREEFDRIVGDRPLEFVDVHKLEFCTQVIEESLRLYPPFWMVDREALSDDEVGDLRIPRGSTVIVFIYGAHHSAQNWPDPESFDPERFGQERRKNHRGFTHLPFGGGPRGCIGGNYAMLQMLMILSVILRRYEFKLAPNQVVEARPMIILRPKNGIRMTFANLER